MHMHRRNKYVKSPYYRHMCKVNIFPYFVILVGLFRFDVSLYYILKEIQDSKSLATKLTMYSSHKFIVPHDKVQRNSRLMRLIIFNIFIVDIMTLLTIFLLCCGDIHPNPGPSSASISDSSTSSATLSSSITSTLASNHSLSIVHYNVQSRSSAR